MSSTSKSNVSVSAGDVYALLDEPEDDDETDETEEQRDSGEKEEDDEAEPDMLVAEGWKTGALRDCLLVLCIGSSTRRLYPAAAAAASCCG